MRRIRSWYVTARYFVNHMLYRAGLRREHPRPGNEWDAYRLVVGDVLGWNRYIRVHNAHLIPRDHPAIFYGNHMKLDDPLWIFEATMLSTGGTVRIGAMLRNDFFSSVPFLKSRFLDMDQLMETVGVFGISRGHVTVSELKRFVDFLIAGHGFILFPGRTRSRSGMLVDYGDGVERPGGISFFLRATQNRAPDRVFGAMPAVRNYNPVTRHSSVIFGPEQTLPRGASREAQRKFDEDLIGVLGPLVEINVAQVVAATLYLRALHGIHAPLGVGELKRMVGQVLDAIDHPYIDPEDMADLDRAVGGAVRYFAKGRMARVRHGTIEANVDAILETPELTTKFRKRNAVKYHTNQILHLGGVVEEIEGTVLRGGASRREGRSSATA